MAQLKTIVASYLLSATGDRILLTNNADAILLEPSRHLITQRATQFTKTTAITAAN